ncbi:hypothetical protein F4677DRAFT_316860 [Hypoxylon crocopeplum]|nr:hypothetical protein F4677DRAFT_316860 [Hypoxylon crocopeplum]
MPSMNDELSVYGCELIDLSATSSTSSTVADDLTPTHTMATDDLNDRCSPPPSPSPSDKETVPWPGRTFIIKDPISGRQITLVRGELRLEYHTGDQGGYHWICVEKNGWLGFCDPVHNTYMGHDNRCGFIAQFKHHKDHESFCARKHPDGGYLLLTQHRDGLRRMDIGEDGHKLVETKDEGTAWEFVRVS